MTDRDLGIRNLIPGVRFDNERAEDERAKAIIKARLGIKDEPDPFDFRHVQPLQFPSIKVDEPVKKKGFTDKELENYMVDQAKWKEKIRKFRQDPKWVSEHNKRFPSFKTTVLPKDKKIEQHGVKQFDQYDKTTYPSHPKQRMALARAEVIDNINQHHVDHHGKPLDKKDSLKNLQNISDLAYQHGDGSRHKSKWVFHPETGDPVDINDPDEMDHPYMQHKMEQLQDIEKKGKSWFVKHLKKQEQQKEVKRLQGIVNQNAKTKDPAAGARYIPREERIQHHYDNLDAARSKRRNVKFI